MSYRFHLVERRAGKVLHEVRHWVGLATARAARRFGRGQLLLHQVMRLKTHRKALGKTRNTSRTIILTYLICNTYIIIIILLHVIIYNHNVLNAFSIIRSVLNDLRGIPLLLHEGVEVAAGKEAGPRVVAPISQQHRPLRAPGRHPSHLFHT